MKFKVGDRVKFRRKKGRVVDIHPKELRLLFPVEVVFDDRTAETFTYDGRQFRGHTIPELIKIDLKEKIQKILKI